MAPHPFTAVRWFFCTQSLVLDDRLDNWRSDRWIAWQLKNWQIFRMDCLEALEVCTLLFFVGPSPGFEGKTFFLISRRFSLEFIGSWDSAYLKGSRSENGWRPVAPVGRHMLMYCKIFFIFLGV